jgi:hypothetical protein
MGQTRRGRVAQKTARDGAEIRARPGVDFWRQQAEPQVVSDRFLVADFRSR